MKYTQHLFFWIILVLSAPHVLAQSISVNDTKNAIKLANTLTNNSSCIQISRQRVYGDDFTTAQNSYGTFDNQGGAFPFTKGVVLSTWSSTKSVGPFTRNRGGGDTQWNGDADLNKSLGINSINATVLEFDFIPLTNFISFNYIFASNEYQDDFPCRFSDGFAFLIKEAGTTNYKNLAVLPDTNIPVSSQNIHILINDFTDSNGFHKGCPAVNENYLEQLNTAQNNSSPINYAGQTIILTAATAVTAGKTYHIKLVIADDEEEYYDSAVFIEAGSFTSKIDLGKDRLLATNNAICFGESYTLNSGFNLSSPYSYKWYKNGATVPIMNEDSSTLIVSSPGDYSVAVVLASGCTATGTVRIQYESKIELIDTTLKKCIDNTINPLLFDLTSADSVIKNGVSTLGPVSYFETLDIFTNTLSDPIINPSNYSYADNATTKIVYGQLTNSSGCSNFAKVTLAPTFYTAPVSNEFSGTIVNDFDGNSNSITINYPGDTNEYKLIDLLSGETIYDFQSNTVFTNIVPGSYQAFVRDTNSCSQTVNSDPIYVLDYPRYFTPNNDNFNDLWTVKNLYLFPKASISIFDRYGKLLKQLNATSKEWNGTYNGHLLPADDYWFHIKFANLKSIKGHFSLKR